MPFFLLSANIFYILLWKKERKGAIITHISAYDAFCADISHYDHYNRAVMLSPLFARSGSIQPFSLPCISRLCDFSDTLKISDIFNVFRNNSRIHIKVILRRSCTSGFTLRKEAIYVKCTRAASYIVISDNNSRLCRCNTSRSAAAHAAGIHAQRCSDSIHGCAVYIYLGGMRNRTCCT